MSTVGHLVTVFAICYAVSSPLLVGLVGRVARRRVLLLSGAVFAGSNLAVALAPSFGALLGMRLVAAVAAAVFTPVAVATGRGRCRSSGAAAR